jgi:hypothetical protein
VLYIVSLYISLMLHYNILYYHIWPYITELKSSYLCIFVLFLISLLLSSKKPAEKTGTCLPNCCEYVIWQKRFWLWVKNLDKRVLCPLRVAYNYQLGALFSRPLCNTKLYMHMGLLCVQCQPCRLPLSCGTRLSNHEKKRLKLPFYENHKICTRTCNWQRPP